MARSPQTRSFLLPTGALTLALAFALAMTTALTAQALPRKIVVGSAATVASVSSQEWAFNQCVEIAENSGLSYGQHLEFLEACCGEVNRSCNQACVGDESVCDSLCGGGYQACRHGDHVDFGSYSPAYSGDEADLSFSRPLVNEIHPSPRVDFCLDGNTGCGAPVAHTVCQRELGEDHGAILFVTDDTPATEEDPTWQLGRWYPREVYGTGGGFDLILCAPLEGTAITFEDVPLDSDYDGVSSAQDNCPNVANPFQRNADGDIFGDACDPEPNVVRACSNGVDDDGDGLPDESDPGCTSFYDDAETDAGLVCDNGLDDDGDGDTDLRDADCANPQDTTEETDYCHDGTDDDGDGLVDGDDPGCSTWGDTTEYGDRWTNEFGNSTVDEEPLCFFGFCVNQDWWWQDATYSRHVADVDGDGRDDVIGFGRFGVHVALAETGAFAPSTLWTEEFELSSFSIGSNDHTPRFVRDVDGDGLADLVVFYETSVLVARSVATGFAPAEAWSAGGDLGTSGFYEANRGDNADILLEDVNGDGLPDLVLFDDGGTVVSLNTGAAFAPSSYWSTDLGTGVGPFHHTRSSRHLGDLDGDGVLDLVAFSDDETWFARGTGSAFEPAQLLISDLGHEWGYVEPRFLVDLDGDGRDDIMAIDSTHVRVIRNPLVGTPAVEWWLSHFGAWGRNASFTDIRLAEDMNDDGMADLLMTDGQGVSVWQSNGTGFEPRIVVGYGVTDSNEEFWRVSSHPRALADVDGDGETELVGFADEGVLVGELGRAADAIPVPGPDQVYALLLGAGLCTALGRRRPRRGVETDNQSQGARSGRIVPAPTPQNPAGELLPLPVYCGHENQDGTQHSERISM